MDSEQLRRVQTAQDARLVDVTITTNGSHTQPGLIEQFLAPLVATGSVGELQEKLLDSLQRLNELSSFKKCEMEVHPGQKPDSALVKLNFEPLRWWGLSMGVDANNEGARTTTTALFRNLRGRCDETKLNFEYKPASSRTGVEISHLDRLFIPGTWQANYSLRNYNDEVDVNLVETGYEGSFTLRSLDGVHQFYIGRGVRTNLIAWERASMELLKQEMPVNARNRLSYTFNLEGRNDKVAPTKGYFLSLTNELAYGADTRYHKVELRGKQYFPISSRIALEFAGFLGAILPWENSKHHVTDRYRGLYLKGFRSVGPRAPPANPALIGKYHLDGDDIGQSSQLTLEAKLLFYTTPVLHTVGLVPYIYANAIGINPLAMTRPVDYAKTMVRTSVGFGLGWSMALGRIEFSYASKVWSKPGDYPAEFQVLFVS